MEVCKGPYTPVSLHYDDIVSWHMSSDGKAMVTTANDIIRVWALPGFQLCSYDWSRVEVKAVAVQASPNRVVAAVVKNRRGEVIVWPAMKEADPQTHSIPSARLTDVMAFSPDGATLAFFDERRGGQLVQWEQRPVATSLEGFDDRSQKTKFCFSPDGTLVTAYRPSVSLGIWNARNGKQVTTLQDRGSHIHCFLPDNSIAVASSSNVVRLFAHSLGSWRLKWECHVEQTIAGLDYHDDVTIAVLRENDITYLNTAGGGFCGGTPLDRDASHVAFRNFMMLRQHNRVVIEEASGQGRVIELSRSGE